MSDMIVAVQFPKPCPLRNTCPILGSYRRLSGFISILLPHVLTTESRLRILGTLSKRILSVVRVLSLLSIFPSSQFLFRHSRGRSWHDTQLPYSVFKRGRERSSRWCHSRMDGHWCSTHDFAHVCIYTGK